MSSIHWSLSSGTSIVHSLGLLVFVQLASAALAQNLVPNGDFEQYTACPDALNQMNRAVGWSSGGLSPDYFNACDVVGFVDVPTNFVGFQQAAGGLGYAGGYTWCEFPANRREIMRVALTSPLVTGSVVYLSMKVAIATHGFQENMRWTVAGLGMRFSNSPFWYDQMSALPDQAMLSMSVAPTDTSIWYVVSGVYIPDSAYSYLAIGNFFSDDLVNPVLVNPDGSQLCAYAYVDDVCVSYDPEECDMATRIVADGGIRSPGLVIAPNPATSSCAVRWPANPASTARLSVHDALGRCVSSTVRRGGGACVLDVESFSPGLYRVVLETPAGYQTASLVIEQR